jgi:ElaB/YqjD/DUF883 family membrane-anchored ribosome-binding protein
MLRGVRMHVLSRVASSASTLVLAALLAAGCGQSEADAEAALCADLAKLRANASELADISASSSIQEFRKARQNVRRAWSDVRDSARNLSNERADALDDAWGELGDTIEGIDGADSLEGAVATIRAGIEDYEATADEIRSEIDCSGAGEGGDNG